MIMTKVSDMVGSTDTARQVAVDALAAMPEDEQFFLRTTADILIRAYEAGDHHMPDFFAAQRLDQEEVLAVWALLPSYVRSAIKKKP